MKEDKKITTNLFKLSEEQVKILVENIGIAFAEIYKLNQENSGEKAIKNNN